jgi:putative oxidoreductase
MFRSDDTGKLVLRLVLGVLILLHGISKLGSGVGFVANMLEAHHLPGVLAYAVFIGEILAPVLLIAGIYTRGAALLIVVNMLVALWLAHSGALWGIGKSGGWVLELQGMFLFSALALSFLGAGRFSVGGSGGRFN